MQSLEQNIEKIKSQMDEILGPFHPTLPQPSTNVSLPKAIDHTFLKPTAAAKDIDILCDQAITFGFGAVCIPPAWTAHAYDRLSSMDIEVASVVGFPLGYTATDVKAFETRWLIDQGATEIDMVLHQGYLHSNQWQLLQADIQAVVEAAQNHCVKVIIETAHCSASQIIQACLISQRAGAHFVKTSTGFASRGASLEDIACMRQTVGGYLGIKASGGIRTKAQAEGFLAQGATQIGASRGANWFG
jgi:deoxyribose-phosphate aldolase